ncbi:transposase [Candidatus Aerophobetes bacterium]|nr:transposase [Candidatus Aerophobetes bacterium]
MNHIKDIHLVFDEENLSKYGAFPLLAWFMLDLMRIREKLTVVSAKRKRNNVRKVKRYKCTFSGVDMSVGIICTILLGIKRFEKIDDLLHTEKKLAEVIGLERFFDKTYARKFLSEFSLPHLRQLDEVNLAILREFGDAVKQTVVVLDIDQTTHSLESKQRQKATRGRNVKRRGKPCYQWNVGFINNEIISQRLADGREHCSQSFIPIIEDVRNKIAPSSLIARVDGGYVSAERLNWIKENNLQVITSVNWDDFLSNNKDLQVDELTFEQFSLKGEKPDEDKKIQVASVGERKVYKKSEYKFQAVLVKIEQEKIPTKKRHRHARYVIIHNVVGLIGARSTFEFYHQRQTIENFFKESKNPFHAGKMPSQRFRANEAYLHFVSIAYNIFSIFKKTICQRYGKDALWRLLAIEPSLMQSE